MTCHERAQFMNQCIYRHGSSTTVFWFSCTVYHDGFFAVVKVEFWDWTCMQSHCMMQAMWDGCNVGAACNLLQYSAAVLQARWDGFNPNQTGSLPAAVQCCCAAHASSQHLNHVQNPSAEEVFKNLFSNAMKLVSVWQLNINWNKGPREPILHQPIFDTLLEDQYLEKHIYIYKQSWKMFDKNT